MADLSKLVEKIKTNAELKKQFSEAVKKDKVVEFCKSLGIKTTKEEIAEFIKAKRCELSEAELNTVSGGCQSSSSEVACEAVLSTCTFGVGCVAASITIPVTELITEGSASSCIK